MSWSIGTVYTKPWFWKKGNRVATISDVLTVKIGGNLNDKKSKNINNRIKSTKYTLYTFIPQNLLEQFRRIANFYFLFMVVISLIIDSPVTPLTSLLPLMFVIAVTAAKQGYEDYLRYRADNMVNYSCVTVIRNGCEENIRSEDILQGDLVKAIKDCDVPCDIVLLKSSDPSGKCFITTANLDGETNLKTLMVPRGLPNIDIDKLNTLGTIECEQSKTDLYTFNGRLELSSMYKNDRISFVQNSIATDKSHALPLMAENLLLRGSRIKNTEWAVGCAVYTGQNTKLSLNSRLTRHKISSSERYVNKFLVFFLVLLISIVTISYFLKRYYDLVETSHLIYLGDIISSTAVGQFLQDYFSFLILYNYLIPISLYVTIELHKFIGSLYLEWDTDLYDEETNQPFIVNTSDLNEELGQIQILFSDKTGTLTKNEMILQQCSINGKKYKMVESGIQQYGRPNVMKIWEFRDDTYNFFQSLSTCHTVQVAAPNSEDSEANGFPIAQSEEEEEVVQKVTSFTNIAEESESGPGNGDSDIDEVDFLSKQKRDISLLMKGSHFGDYSPLLLQRNYSESSVNITGAPSSPLSSNSNMNSPTPSINKLIAFERKANLQRPLSLIDYPTSFSPKMSPLHMRKQYLTRPLSIELKRTISAVDNERPGYMTHRRTQSSGAEGRNRRDSNSSGFRSNRNSVLRQSGHLREYYAAPAFNRSSLIERKESMRRKKELNESLIKLDYQASSPDEKALVEACARVGFLFTGEVNDMLTVQIQSYNKAYTQQSSGGKELRFQRLHVLEFTSDRKRMSTIYRDSNEQIWIITKGAESHVFPLCQRSNPELLGITQAHINDFAKVGLRTLAVARRRLTEEEYAQFANDITEASNSLTNRNQLIEEVQSKIENNLEILGATAVEDALQDDVKDTLDSLREAGIGVWVLTGDKIETALNIALACGHISEHALKYFITECSEEAQLIEHLNTFEREFEKYYNAEFSLLIDGSSLAIALKFLPERFRDIAIRCRAVLCCRLSPLQKCEVVHLIRTSASKPITAAIGDGANDVSMIQEAHVGLGIVGKEGRQAARCADYAFANFSMLKKIVLVHGHYYTQRIALLVLYFFYKNLVFMLIQIFFQINSMFSTQTVYDSLFLTLYNVMFTSCPVLVISLTEKIHAEGVLLKKPSLYKSNTGNKPLHWQFFVGWMTIGFYHSSIIYLSGYMVWRDTNTIFTTAHTTDFLCFGTFLFHNVVVLVNLKLLLESKYQTYWLLVTTFGSILIFVLISVVYTSIVEVSFGMYKVYTNLLSSITVWLLFLVITIAAFIPDFAMKSCKAMNIKLGRIFPGKGAIFSKKIYAESTYL